MKFEDTDLGDDVLDALDAMNFSECTPVQEQAIPAIMEGRDLIAVAQTGTGKTAAYLLPIIDEILRGGYPQDCINCLVMVPTRELAMQIDQQLQGMAYYVPISSIAVYGGTDGKVYTQQHQSLTSGVDIVIATPGRLMAHMAMGKVDLGTTAFLVLDEADRMLDMGFCDDIMQIVAHLPKKRQTMMFSATMPPSIEQLAGAVLTDPLKIKLAVSRPPEKIRQMACVCNEGEKEPLLTRVLQDKSWGKTIVFAASKLRVKDMSRNLRRAGVKCAEMHSDLDQERREETMRAFKAGRVNVLVATDIVARGIDIDDIQLAINYDVPHECEDYVHRVGRTARADRDGTSLTFVGPKDRRSFAEIEKFLGKRLERMEVPEDLRVAASQSADRPARRHGSCDNGPRKPRRANGSGEQHRKTSVEANTDTPKEKTTANDKEARPRRKSFKPRKSRRNSGEQRPSNVSND